MDVNLHFLSAVCDLKKKTAFTFGGWCYYAFTVTVSYVITRERWFCVYFLHAENFLAFDQIQLDAYRAVVWSRFEATFKLRPVIPIFERNEITECPIKPRQQTSIGITWHIQPFSTQSARSRHAVSRSGFSSARVLPPGFLPISLLLLLFLASFSYQLTPVGFHWNRSANKSSLVSRTFIGILTESKQSCKLNDLDSSSDFHFLQSLFGTFWDHSRCSNHNWYHRHSHVQQLFQFSGKLKVLLSFILFFLIFTLWSVGTEKNPRLIN